MLHQAVLQHTEDSTEMPKFMDPLRLSTAQCLTFNLVLLSPKMWTIKERPAQLRHGFDGKYIYKCQNVAFFSFQILITFQYKLYC